MRYELAGTAGANARIKKNYELRTLAQGGDGPHIQMEGSGDISFGTDIGAVRSCDFKVTHTVTDNGTTTKLPLSVSYRLLEGAALAALKKQREEARARAKEANTPKALTDADITAALADLKSSEFFTFSKAAERLARSIPLDGRRAEVAGALETALANNDGQLRAAAARALKTWATPKNVPALIRALKGSDVFARFAAIEALGALKDAKGAAAVAELLPELQVRMQATSALKAMGTIAEKSVIPFLKDGGWVVRLEACTILHDIGTRAALAPFVPHRRI